MDHNDHRKAFLNWIKVKGAYSGRNHDRDIDRYLQFIDFDPFNIAPDFSNIDSIISQLKASRRELNSNTEFLKINKDASNGAPSAIMGSENLIKYLKALKQHSVDSSVLDRDLQSTQQHSVNTILYGPPGTGKTYNTINKAVAIANPVFDIQTKTREEVYTEFERLIEQRQVQFITFHQSLSYEDFIEGLKPEYDESSRSLRYPTKDGLFKQICFMALKALHVANVEEDEELDLDKLYNDFVQHLLDTFETGNYPFQTKDRSEMRPDQVELAKGALVVYYRWNNNATKQKEGTTAFPIKKEKITAMYKAGVGPDEVNLKQRLKPDILTYHLSPYYAVYKSFLQFVKDHTGSMPGDGSNEIEVERDYESYLQQLQLIRRKNGHLKPGKPFVLIIDEINRGNISQIFGELITLIEVSKRADQPEALQAILPYSRGAFSVPSNLYLIGTMNTADRSVEALDAALRRRFAFIEMMPDYTTLRDGNNARDIEGINLEALLQTINARITWLKDRDHQIGHTFLMNVRNKADLCAAFKTSIVPLLQEYFFNDLSSIQAVLGPGFVTTQEQPLFPKGVQPQLGNGDALELVTISEGFNIIAALNQTLNIAGV